MLIKELFIISVVTSPGILSNIQNRVNSCSATSTLNILATFRCHDGTGCIDIKHVCDAVTDCADASDEKLCSHHDKRSHFQSNGEVLHRNKRQIKCGLNQVRCPDGSCVSQSEECRLGEACVLPPYPDHGTYRVRGVPNAQPGQDMTYVLLTMSCERGYGILRTDPDEYRTGTQEVLCVDGNWQPRKLPQCVRFCPLVPDPSILYACWLPKAISLQYCARFVPPGTVVHPQCNTPVYHSYKSLSYMYCQNGTWDYVAKCDPDCGRVTPDALELISNGRTAKRGELPWHVGIYTKRPTSYRQICGGSLVSNNAVISAAHCFWDDISMKLPPERFAVAVGKLHRSWKSKADKESQESDVKEILIPEQFQGSGSILQADVAVLLLVTSFVYKFHVKPICLNFDKNFDKQQLQGGNYGKVAGWGLTAANGPEAKMLNVIEMPYIGYKQCVKSVPQSFKQFITIDKFCAGHTNGTAVCRGDSGGGLAFPAIDSYIERYYLRGVVSAAPRSDDGDCNIDTYATFTRVSIYAEFIKDAVQGKHVRWAPVLATRVEDIPKEPNLPPRKPVSEKPEIAIGNRDCGLSAPPSPEGNEYVPWHVGFYRKTSVPYQLVCGGSLITNNLVISAANCFWKQPASDFLAAIGKIHQSWSSPEDVNAQKSEIKEINIPASYDDILTHFQNNIAIVTLANPFTYTIYARPVCLDVDTNFDSLQLQPGKDGKVAGWSATTASGTSSPILKVFKIPYVNHDTCVKESSSAFAENITGDKFCAGDSNGSALCPGDGGGGIAFPQRERGRSRYYLRGVASVPPSSDNKCHVDSYMLFTRLTAHEQFIREFISVFFR